MTIFAGTREIFDILAESEINEFKTANDQFKKDVKAFLDWVTKYIETCLKFQQHDVAEVANEDNDPGRGGGG